ncbi:MAG: DoxX family protein [Lactobacillaceae bacterium]|jgi:thiosulfate dehydrogenase [quinone] large subunit|nr:DoxX family protein [Lactobacillaceae bacterium]
MMNWLRHNFVASIILTVIRVYLGYEWMMDGINKLTMKGGFSAQGMIMGAIKQPVVGPHGQPYPLFTWFLKTFTDGGKHAEVFSFLVSWGEFLVGLGMIVGLLTLPAVFFALVMNFSYMFAGVISVNPWYILLEFFLMAGGFNSAKIGLDRWATPWFRKVLPFLRKHGETEVRIEKALTVYE